MRQFSDAAVLANDLSSGEAEVGGPPWVQGQLGLEGVLALKQSKLKPHKSQTHKNAEFQQFAFLKSKDYDINGVSIYSPQ